MAMGSTRAEWRRSLSEKIQKNWESSEVLDRMDVRKVCVLLSASRSGSSFLFHLLSKHPSVISPMGEETPFYRLAGLGWVDERGQSDRLLSNSKPALGQVADWILRDAGRTAENAKLDLRDVLFRLLLQWPFLADHIDRVRGTATRLMQANLEPENFWSALLAELRQFELSIDPGFYDFTTRGSSHGGGLFPGRDVFEEPPYIIPRPRLRARTRDLQSHTLLLKSSTNSYRIPQLRELFPHAEYSVIYLSRNPAGCVNGLMDGWLSGLFHSHDLEGIADLKIQGYTRADRPESHRWWKFDLPPGWERLMDAPLEEVCAAQWRSANQHILRDAALLGDSHRVRYENLLDPALLGKELRSIFEFLGLSGNEAERIANEPARIMAVNPPGRGKWKARRDRILPLLSNPEVRDTAAQMGYDLRDPEALF